MDQEKRTKIAEEAIEFFRRITVVAILRGEFDEVSEDEFINKVNGLANDALLDAKNRNEGFPI